ncbi:hypothetical protein ABN028_11215 [Actinopolymorpha sp. B17G11]|uniref:hypothetical protein n=1 Tax=Actinopolymorpha sp. B17G11 TaxID=3160861 RepID=UPI0032E52BF7
MPAGYGPFPTPDHLAGSRWTVASNSGSRGGDGLSDEDQRAELERLRSVAARAQADADEARAEAAGLRAQRGGEASAAAHRPGGRGRWRTPIAVLLVLLGSLFAPLATAAVWVHTELSDTERYVETVAPLATDPAVQAAVAGRTTDAIITRLDVDRVLRQAVNAIIARTDLPPVLADRLRGVSGAMSDGIHSFVETRVGNLVRSDQFAHAWVQANRVAHQEMVNVLSGQESAVTVEGDVVSLQLGPFIEVAKQDLTDAGFTLAESLPPINPSIELFRTEALTKAQSAYTLLNRLSSALPVLSVGCLAAGVVVARRRRRMLVAAGLGVAGGMVLLGVVLAIGRAILLRGVESSAAGAAIYDTLVRYLQDQLWTLGVLGLVVACGAFMTGPSTIASRTRSFVVAMIQRLQVWTESHGLHVGTAGPWVYDNARWLRVIVIAVAGLILVAWHQPGVLVVISLAGSVVVALALIAFLARRGSVDRDATH